MAFTVGMKVVVVPVVSIWTRPPHPFDPPTLIEGNIYTIRAIDTRQIKVHRVATILLEEIIAPTFNTAYGKWEIGYVPYRFRPLISRKTDISFTAGADPESEKWDNRKPAPVYAFDEAGHEDILQYLRGFY